MIRERISRDKEMKAIAMLARGDIQKDIAQELEITPAAVTYIKQRNQDALNTLKSRLTDRAHDLAVLNHTRALERLNTRLDDPKIHFETKDLVSVAREMFNEKQVTEGNPTQIVGSQNSALPTQQKQNLRQLVDAIEAGDEVIMSQIIFNPHDISQPT